MTPPPDDVLVVGPFTKRSIRAACAGDCANCGTHESHMRDALIAAVGSLDTASLTEVAVAAVPAYAAHEEVVEAIMVAWGLLPDGPSS